MAAIIHKFVYGFRLAEQAIRDGWRIYRIHELADGGYEFDLYKPAS